LRKHRGSHVMRSSVLVPLIVVAVMVFVAATALSHDVGRICSNSRCGMCNALHLRAGHGVKVSRYLPYAEYVRIHNELHRKAVEPKANQYLAPVPDSVRLDLDDPDFQPTPLVVVKAMLELVKPAKDEVLCDLGCGDGRIVIAAAKTYGCRAVGVEIDEANVDLARRNVRFAGVGSLVEIVHADARTYKLDKVDVVTLYLFPALIKQLEPEVFKAKRIVSYSHEIPGVANRKVMVDGKYPVFLWRQTSNGILGGR